jgi:hypothetical protein
MFGVYMLAFEDVKQLMTCQNTFLVYSLYDLRQDVWCRFPRYPKRRGIRLCALRLQYGGRTVWNCDFFYYLCELVPLLWGNYSEFHSHPNHIGADDLCTYKQPGVCNGKSKLHFSAERQGLGCFDVTSTATYFAHRALSRVPPALEYLGGTPARIARETTVL